MLDKGNFPCPCTWIHFNRWSIYSFLHSSLCTKTSYPCDKCHATFLSLGGQYTLRCDRLSTYSRHSSREKLPVSKGSWKFGNFLSNFETGQISYGFVVAHFPFAHEKQSSEGLNVLSSLWRFLIIILAKKHKHKTGKAEAIVTASRKNSLSLAVSYVYGGHSLNILLYCDGGLRHSPRHV